VITDRKRLPNIAESERQNLTTEARRKPERLPLINTDDTDQEKIGTTGKRGIGKSKKPNRKLFSVPQW
jgi:hypothetical protein